MSETLESTAEKEIEVLETILHADENDRQVVQRDIAHIVGVSIGMTNAIIKRLAKKGLLTIRKVNNRNVRYALSPEGMRVLSEKSYRYFKRTIKNVVFYKEKIGDAVYAAAEQGYDTIVLAGESDLDFIVEHFCYKYGLGYRRVKGGIAATGDSAESTADEACGPAVIGPGEYPMYSEKIAPPEGRVADECGPDGSGANTSDPDSGSPDRSEAFYLRTIVV
jgi:DNA-binding MarR family transcriptional regulator